jgi:ubiquinone/menaquinone biosynthesis C-methylase UbiE
LSCIEYHLKELAIASDNTDELMILPELLDSDEVILDLGCGIGQTLIALRCKDRICIGIDVEPEAIRYGIAHYGNDIQFILSDADHIPIPDDTLDLVYSRVALPYTNIPKVIKEVKRSLKVDGRIWMTLHSKAVVSQYVKDAVQQPFNIKRWVHLFYILTNGYCFKWFGQVFPFLNGRYESWQDPIAMEKLLKHHGFEVKSNQSQHHTIIEGVLKSKK